MVRCFRTAAVSLALFACLVSSIQAQNAASGAPKAYKKNEKAITDPKLVKSHAKEAADALRGTNFGNAEQAIVKRYFVDTVMAGMTLQSNDPQQFPKWREQIVKALGSLSSASGSARHDYLRGEVFRVAKAMAEDPEYSPQCRYNSLLILGELNDTEMQRNGQNVQPAVPSTQARKVLLDLFKNEKESQALRLAALIGLQRHERLLAAAGRTDNDIVQAAKSTLSVSAPPANGTADGLHWMQRIAVDILASHGKGAEAALLEPIISDAKRPMLVRCAAAEALGRLDYAGVTNLNAAALSKGLGQIALSACQTEILSLQSKVAASPLEGGGVIRSEPIEGERPTEKQGPENPDVKLARRQLKYQLTCVSQGLTGLLKATMDDNSKSAMTSLKTQVDAVLKTLEPAPDLQPASLLDKISQPAVQLEKLVNSLS